MKIEAINQSEMKLHVYPNPNIGKFSLEVCGPVSDACLVKMLDNRGVVLYRNKIDVNKLLNVDFIDLSPGSYTVMVENETTDVRHEVIVQK